MNPEYMGSINESIYGKRHMTKGLYGKLNKFDIIENMKPLLDRGLYAVTSNGIIKRNSVDAIQYETPWHHVNPCPFKQCNIDHQIKFNHFGYVPPKCLECWKVVVGPRTLKELFQLVDIQKGTNHPCKAGIEMRAYTSKPYGGYFYNNSLDEGRDTYEWVRKAVTENISEDVPVLLKRGCTEYEMALGNSLGWHMNDVAWQLEEMIETHIDDNAKGSVRQPDLVVRHVHKRWIEYAYKLGDKTYLDYTDGEPLYPGYQTYHDTDLATLKVQLSDNRAVNAGVPQKVSRHLQWQIGNLMENADINRRQFGAAFGNMYIDPHTIYEHSDYPY